VYNHLCKSLQFLEYENFSLFANSSFYLYSNRFIGTRDQVNIHLSKLADLINHFKRTRHEKDEKENKRAPPKFKMKKEIVLTRPKVVVHKPPGGFG